jgi:hypothetical protein
MDPATRKGRLTPLVLAAIVAVAFVCGYLVLTAASAAAGGTAQAKLAMENTVPAAARAAAAGQGGDITAAHGGSRITVTRRDGSRSVHALAMPRAMPQATAELQKAGGQHRATQHRATHTPDSAQVKLIAAYLAEDVDPDTQNNVGQTEMLYLHPQCVDIGDCGVEASNPDGGSGDPEAYVQVTEYFELAQASAAVNAELNAQNRDIAAGTYRAIRLEMCRSGGEVNNQAFQAEDMAEPHAFPTSQCGVTAEITPPLTLAGGDTVVVSVAYDLTDSVTSFDEPQDPLPANCTNTTPSYCYSMPELTPSAGAA